jgi:hypothetical protein
MLNISTQRGCGQPCCFCTYPLIEGHQNRRRAPEAVADELAAIERQGAKHVFITDAVFNLTNEHVFDICDAILRRHVNLTWGCFLRPKNLTAELMTLMARAGLTHIEFGADSFCDEVLVEYGKTFTFADIVHSTELARAAHVHYSHFVICGGPGETRKTLRTGFANSQRLTNAIIFVFAGCVSIPARRCSSARNAKGCYRLTLICSNRSTISRRHWVKRHFCNYWLNSARKPQTGSPVRSRRTSLALPNACANVVPSVRCGSISARSGGCVELWKRVTRASQLSSSWESAPSLRSERTWRAPGNASSRASFQRR